MQIRILAEHELTERRIAGFFSAAQREHWPEQGFGGEWIRAKFFRSPCGPSLFALAEEQDEVAGVVAFGRLGLRVGGEAVAGALSYETFVSPDFRGRGLFLELLERATEAARADGIRLLFNFPNPASLPGFLKRGWTRGRGFQNWLRPLRPLDLVRAIRAGQGGDFVPDEPRETPLVSADLAPFLGHATAAPSRFIEPDYREDFLRWRFGPDWKIDYHTVGASALPMIVRSGRRWGSIEVQILEVARDRPLRRSAIAATLAEIRERWNPIAITASLSTAHPMTRALPFAGFVPAPTRSNFCSLPLDPEMAARVQTARWSLTGTLAHRY